MYQTGLFPTVILNKYSTFPTVVSSSITYNISSNIANIQLTCYDYITIHVA